MAQPPQKGNQVTVNCPACGQECANAHGLQVHIARSHKGEEIPEPPTGYDKALEAFNVLLEGRGVPVDKLDVAKDWIELTEKIFYEMQH